MVKYIILTYDENIPFAKITQKRLKEDWGITAEILSGYGLDETTSTGKKTGRTTVLSWAWNDKLIPQLKGDFVYLEDDVRFTSNPENYVNIAKDIVWMVYRKGKLTNKPPHNVITGSQAIYFSNDAVKTLKTWWHKNRQVHLDRKISKFITENPQLSFFQLKKPIGYEEDHQSLISKDDWEKYKKPPK